MKDLAPDIFRQRLLVEGIYEIDVRVGTVQEFFVKLQSSLDVTASGEAIINSSLGQGKPENQGIEAFLPLIESGVALYTWESSRFISLIIYTCRAFDEKKAVAVVTEYFELSRVEFKTF